MRTDFRIAFRALRRSPGLVIAGLGAGLLGVAAAARLLGSLLPGVAVTDPLAIGGALLLLATVALLATWLPALRASRVDPVMALRAD